MPPVLRVRPEGTEVISKDPALTGIIKDKFIFTDISLGVPDRVSITTSSLAFCGKAPDRVSIMSLSIALYDNVLSIAFKCIINLYL